MKTFLTTLALSSIALAVDLSPMRPPIIDPPDTNLPKNCKGSLKWLKEKKVEMKEITRAYSTLEGLQGEEGNVDNIGGRGGKDFLCWGMNHIYPGQ